jgi:hypothetical protein
MFLEKLAGIPKTGAHFSRHLFYLCMSSQERRVIFGTSCQLLKQRSSLRNGVPLSWQCAYSYNMALLAGCCSLGHPSGLGHPSDPSLLRPGTRLPSLCTSRLSVHLSSKRGAPPPGRSACASSGAPPPGRRALHLLIQHTVSKWCSSEVVHEEFGGVNH